MGPRVKNKSATFGGAWTFLPVMPALPSCSHQCVTEWYVTPRERTSNGIGCCYDTDVDTRTARVNSAEPMSLICPLFPTKMMMNKIPITDTNIYGAWGLIFNDQRLFCLLFFSSSVWIGMRRSNRSSHFSQSTFPYPHCHHQWWWGLGTMYFQE